MRLLDDGDARKFLTFLLLGFLTDICWGLITVAVPLYLTSLGTSSLEFGVIIAAASIGSLVIKVPLGAISDKIGKKPFIYLGFALLVASTVLFPIYSGQMAFMRIAQGLALSLVWVPLTALFIEAFRKPSAFVYFAGAYTCGFLVGNLLGGFLPQLAGFTVTFLLGAGVLVLCVLILTRIEDTRAAPSQAGPGGRIDVPRMAVAWTIGAANSAALSIFLAFIPLFALRQLGLSSGDAGLLIFLEGATYILLVMPVGRIADGHRKYGLILLCTGALAGVFFILYSADSLAMLAVGSVLLGVISAIISPLSTALAGDSMPDKGKAMGIYQTGFDVGSLAGPVIAGALSGAFGLQYAFLAVVPIVLACFVLILIPGLRIARDSRQLPLAIEK